MNSVNGCDVKDELIVVDVEISPRNYMGFRSISDLDVPWPFVSCFPSESSRIIADAELPLCTLAVDRIAGIVADDVLMSDAGPALHLLLKIVVRCGAGDSCQIVASSVTQEMKACRNSVGNWLGALEKLGILSVDSRGKDGVMVRLNTEKLKPAGVCAGIRDDVNNLMALTEGTRQVQSQVADGMLALLKRVINKLT